MKQFQVGPALLRRALLASTLLLTACTSIGTRTLPRNHLAYNHAVSDAEGRELLLNVIRIRYGDALQFLSVDHVTTSFSLNAGVAGDFGVTGDDPNALIGPVVTYGDSPTITYTPQGDSKFAENILSAASPRHVILSLEAVQDLTSGLRLLLTEINGARDAAGEEGARFRHLTQVLGELRRDDRIGFRMVRRRKAVGPPRAQESISQGDLLEALEAGYSFEPAADGQVVMVGTSVHPAAVIHAVNERETLETLSREGIATLGSVVPMTSASDLGLNGRPAPGLAIVARSVLAIMSVLARGVEVPPAHTCAGLVPSLRRFPGSGGPGEMIRIRSGATCPPSRTSVFHRGFWYWIDDADVRSKANFAALRAVYTLRLKEAPDKGSRPVLTLPVGG